MKVDPKAWFNKAVEWDKKLIKKCQDKFGLTDYQVVCISFAKGFIIGAILLWLGIPHTDRGRSIVKI